MKGSFLAVVACAASLAVAAPVHARAACWERVISDWSVDNRVTGHYTVGCYRQALANLPEDLRTYSSASDDIRRGLQAQLARAPAVAKTPARQAGGSGGNGQVLVLAAVLAAILVVAVAVIR